jgi:DnaJ like chaperone protein
MMNILQTWFARIIGTLLGLSGAGLFGAMAGFAIGSIIDKLHRDGFFLWEGDRKNGESGDFIFSTMILATAILKAKSDNQETESTYIFNFLKEQYGEIKAAEYLKILNKTMKQEWDIRKITQQLRSKNNYETRLQLLFFLFGIANADTAIEDKELAILKIIGIHLGISANDFEAISSNFLSELDKSYRTLKINPDASEQQIKDAYRILVNKYHPDKITESNSLSSFAEEKFQKVQLAYNRIKTEKGFK